LKSLNILTLLTPLTVGQFPVNTLNQVFPFWSMILTLKALRLHSGIPSKLTTLFPMALPSRQVEAPIQVEYTSMAKTLITPWDSAFAMGTTKIFTGKRSKEINICLMVNGGI
jgi:hypothetical protein